MEFRTVVCAAMMLTVLAGPSRCCCGIRASKAADAGRQTPASCSCCRAAAATPTGESAAVPAPGAGSCSVACEGCRAAPDGDRRPDDEGCPARGKPGQAWDVGGDGPGAKVKPGSASLPRVGGGFVDSRLPPADRGVSAVPAERAAVWGRGLLLRLQILRC